MSRKDSVRELADVKARQAALLDWAAAELGTSLIHRRIREHLGVDASVGAMVSAMRAALNGRGFPEADPVLPETEPSSVLEPADWATSTHVKVTVSGDRTGAMAVTNEPVTGELCSDKAGPHTEHDWRDAEDLDVLIPCPGIREPEARRG